MVTGGNWAHIKSMGPTELLHPVELREEGHVLARLLSVIFKSSLRIGEASDNWRKAKVSTCGAMG